VEESFDELALPVLEILDLLSSFDEGLGDRELLGLELLVLALLDLLSFDEGLRGGRLLALELELPVALELLDLLSFDEGFGDRTLLGLELELSSD
jgi:hypothetical protein